MSHRPSRSSRRTFLKRSLAAAGAGAAFTIAGTKSSGKVIGANDVIRVGVAGLNGRGQSHLADLLNIKGVEVTYLIDPDQRTYKKSLSRVSSSGGSPPKTVTDIREALDDKNLDVVTIATPNHWHSLISIWACQAGKDVYVEKPCSHNVHEGRIAVEAAQIQPHRPARHPEPFRRHDGRHGGIHQERQGGQVAGGSRPVLQATQEHRLQRSRHAPLGTRFQLVARPGARPGV